MYLNRETDSNLNEEAGGKMDTLDLTETVLALV